ncbi:Uncharacterised protein [Mycobacteroides abscessus subsp. abscessus]|nr:Uncharacterised protein [Mycobacteroides abscessus subsp. abscessus]
MKIGSGSTVMLGNSLASCPAIAQCVVARHPSSRPASAARNAPLHPPGRSNVSQPSSGSGKGWVTNSIPEPVDTGDPSAETSFTS